MILEQSYGVIPLKHSEKGWSVLLILHSQGNHWSFPKGKAEPGEGALQTAQRELKEETGLDIERVLKEDPYIESYYYRKKGEGVTKEVLYFPAIVSGELALQEAEIRDAGWFTPEEALERLSFKEAKNLLHEVVKLLIEMGL